jgi:Protein of unknown function (DUF2924)
MPRPSFEREGIEAEIDRVRSLGVDSLRTLWRTTFRSSPPPAFSKDILARYLCWGIQEQAFGGRPQRISMDSRGATGHQPIALGASNPAPCSCANTRASGTPSPSLQRAMSGARRLMPASPLSRERSPVRPGTARAFLVSGSTRGPRFHRMQPTRVKSHPAGAAPSPLVGDGERRP